MFECSIRVGDENQRTTAITMITQYRNTKRCLHKMLEMFISIWKFFEYELMIVNSCIIKLFFV